MCQVELQVVLLTSTKTQIPFDYYRAPFCRPDKITKEAENLGEVRARACCVPHLHFVQLASRRLVASVFRSVSDHAGTWMRVLVGMVLVYVHSQVSM